MKTYKIDPLKKQRPLMLFRGTRIPEVLPDTVAEQLINSLNENSRGFIVGIDGNVRFVNAQGNPSCMLGRDHSLVMFNESGYEGVSSMTLEDANGQQSKIECNRVTKGSQYNGSDTYYTGPYKDLKQFVRDVTPYTGQPLNTANCRKWFSYTTPEGVALTFRGCIQAQKSGGEYVGLSIDKIELRHSTVSGSTQDISEDLCITLDCTESVLLGGLNGMVGSMPANLNPGIGWLQIVATDEFKSHLSRFNEADGNADARIFPNYNYDGFTYNIAIGGIDTDYNVFRTPGNMASCRIKVKENSALCNSTIVDKVGYAAEYFGFNRAYPVYRDVYDEINPTLDGDAITVGVGPIFEKLVVIDLPNVNSNDQYLHISLPETVVDHSSIRFVTTDGRKVGESFVGAGENEASIPAMPNVFAFFFFTDMNGTASVQFSRVTKQSEPTRTPGFYGADGQLIKAMTKDEVEQGYGYDNYPAKANEAIKSATRFVWPEGVTRVGANVFSDCTGLTEVDIPNTVTSVGESSFKGCTGLTTVAIQHGVTSIGMAAFNGCTALATAPIPSTVTTIGSEAFRGTKLTTVDIPQGVTAIDWNTFSECTDLTSVTIPNTVTEIRGGAFNGCTGLNPLTVPNTVTTIGNAAFMNVPKVFYSGTATGSPWGALQVSRTPGFYSADGRLIKSMTKDEIEAGYSPDNCPSKTNAEIKNATEFVWPEGVTRIGSQVFNGCAALTSLDIPEGVTSIGNHVFFNCQALTSITIPDGVTTIGAFAFSNCRALTEITIPEGVTALENCVFDWCLSLTSVTLPSTLTKIGSGTFNKCSKISPALVVPNGVTTIRNNAFTEVPKVIYGGTATGSPWGALEVVAPTRTPGFYNAEGQLIKAMTKEEVETDYTDSTAPAVIDESIKNATEFVWPEGVTKIGEFVFSHCDKLASVTIPDGVTSIGMRAFYLCSALTSVTIQDGVTSIGGFAFDACSSLTSVDIPEGVTTVGRFAFNNCSALESVTIPSTVTSIEQHTFQGCTSLTSVTIPDGVTSIGQQAFSDCSGLTSVTIPSTVTSIGSSAFSSCTGLTSVTIQDGVTSIESYAFDGCTGLNPLVVPNTVTTIKSNAFLRVPKVIYGGSATGSPWGALEVLTEAPKTPGFYSADGQLIKAMTKEEVEQNYMNGKYPTNVDKSLVNATEFVWPEGVTSVGRSVFQGCTGLNSVTIPDGVTSIGNSAFYECSGLTSVTIPDGVTSIGDFTFSNCTGLTSVTIPEGVTSIGSSAFYGCTGLTSVTIPEGVTSIGRTAFSYCSGLTSLTIPSTVTSIGISAFSKSGLTSVTIPDGVTTISSSAFRNCSSLTSVTIPIAVTSIESYAFEGCTDLTSVNIPEGVTSIGKNAFADCTSLNPLTVPNTVTTIGTDAFKNVPKVIYGGTATGRPWGAKEVLTEIPRTPGFYSANGTLLKAMTKDEVERDYPFNACPSKTNAEIKNATEFVWPEGVTKVGNYVFWECSGLTSVTIPEGVTSIGNTAFKRCAGLTSVTIPSTVTEIYGFAFSECTALNPLTVPNTVTTIDTDAFRNVPKVIYNGPATGSPWGAVEVAAS